MPEAVRVFEDQPSNQQPKNNFKNDLSTQLRQELSLENDLSTQLRQALSLEIDEETTIAASTDEIANRKKRQYLDMLKDFNSRESREQLVQTIMYNLSHGLSTDREVILRALNFRKDLTQKIEDIIGQKNSKKIQSS